MEASVVRTNSENPDFIRLNSLLNLELAVRDGEDYPFYAQYNTIDQIKYVIVAYEDNIPVACGAIKKYHPGIMEIKRMFTIPENRGKEIAMKVLTELETWTLELGFKKCILETGMKQPEAISLYKKCGYQIIQNYGQYSGVENSVCFEKVLH